MAAMKTFVLALLVTTVLARASHADPITLQWKTWNPTGSGVSGGVPQNSFSFASLFWPTATTMSAPTLSAMTQPTTRSAPVAPTQAAPVVVPQAPAFQPAPVQQHTIQAAPIQNYVPPQPAFQAAASQPAPVNAYVNVGNGPFPGADSLTTGNAQAWYNSPQIVGMFGGRPTAQQQAAFDSTVVQRVEQTFQLSGLPITLTTDPKVPAAHTLSIVSNTGNGTVPDAIGMTTLGGDGFHFIDGAAKAATSVDQLEWIVAHNVSHELMLAFGVGENYDSTGNFIDARNASLSMMLNPNATFSPAAAQALLSNDLGTSNASGWVGSGQFAQVIPQPVPEPATVIFWSLTTLAAGYSQRKRLLRRAS